MDPKIEAVQRMQNYIESHLQEPFCFASVAKVSCFSPWYARRIFLELLDVTPSEYARKTRLKKAALDIRDKKARIIDAAFAWGFESVDGFTRAFYKEFGCNPKEFAKKKIPIPLFISYDIMTQYPRKEKTRMKTRNIFLSVVEKPRRKVIIKRGKEATEYWSYCQEVGCEVWGILSSIPSLTKEPVCLWLPSRYVKEGTSVYVQGAEVPLDYDGVIPEGFDLIELPEAKYLMFQGEAFEEADFEEAIEEVWKAEESYDPSILGYSWDEENPKIQLEPIGKRGYIELLPIR
ncbi:MAG: AraC family transcriptional regulator [Candidatus Enteromonas sp.]|nr:AraC family transcriptional regulator [Candidatus Enteromonas sp.]